MSNTIKIVRGSHIYGTAHEHSDIDMVWIVPSLGRCPEFSVGDDGYVHISEDKNDQVYDIIMMEYAQFVDLVNNYDIMAIEALYSNNQMDENKHLINHLQYKKIDLWKLRQSISAVCNNSWAKFHKKLTVERDYDLYIGLKSLFHVMRMYRYGIQIAKFGKIIDFECKHTKDYDDTEESLKDLYGRIMSMSDKPYIEIKNEMQPLRNKYATIFKKYCPKQC